MKKFLLGMFVLGSLAFGECNGKASDIKTLHTVATLLSERVDLYADNLKASGVSRSNVQETLEHYMQCRVLYEHIKKEHKLTPEEKRMTDIDNELCSLSMDMFAIIIKEEDKKNDK